jgi:hypothetical protein
MFDASNAASIDQIAYRLKDRIFAAYRQGLVEGIEEPAVLALDLRDQNARDLALDDFTEAAIKEFLIGAERLGKVAWIFSCLPRKEIVTRLIDHRLIGPGDVDSTGPLDGFALAVITPDDSGVLEVPLPQ